MRNFTIGPVAIALFLVTVLTGCGEKYEVIYEGRIIPGHASPVSDTLMKDPVQNFLFSRLHSPETAGAGFTFRIPAQFQGKELCIVYSGRIRSNYAHSNSSISMALYGPNKKQLDWKVLPLRTCYEGVNTWSHFRDSIELPKNIYGKVYSTINGFPYLGNSTDELFDLDTLYIKVKRKL